MTTYTQAAPAAWRMTHTGGMEPLHVPAGCMSAHQAAESLGVGLPAVRKLVERGHLTRAGGSPRQPYYASEQVRQLARARGRA